MLFLVLLFLVPTAIALAIAHANWHRERKRRVIERWAAKRGVLLLSYEDRWLARGPFFFTAAENQVVYRITVEYPNGRIATGWAKCGNWLIGLLSDEVDVIWDEEKRKAPGFPVIMKGDK